MVTFPIQTYKLFKVSKVRTSPIYYVSVDKHKTKQEKRAEHAAELLKKSTIKTTKQLFRNLTPPAISAEGVGTRARRGAVCIQRALGAVLCVHL